MTGEFSNNTEYDRQRKYNMPAAALQAESVQYAGKKERMEVYAKDGYDSGMAVSEDAANVSCIDRRGAGLKRCYFTP